MKQFNSKIIQKTIRNFILGYGDINVSPTGQRLDTSSGLIGSNQPSKAQGIINAILCGINPGMITLHRLKNPPYQYESPDIDAMIKVAVINWLYESVDGGHRKRYIKAFVENKFPCFYRKKYFRDLSKEEQEYFLSVEITFCIYEDLLPEDIAYIFQNTNKSTDVNHQENLNAYNDIPVATVIRNTVRPVPGVGNRFHSLFGYVEKNGGDKKVYTYLQFGNERLRIDEMVARIFYRYAQGGGMGTCTRDNVEEMYKSYPSQETMDTLAKKVKKVLNFVLAMAEIRLRRFNKNGLTLKEFSIFQRLYMYMESEFGDFTINDHDELFNRVIVIHNEYMKKYENQKKLLQKPSPFDSTKTRGKQYNDSLNEYDTLAHYEYPVKMLLEELDLSDLLTLKDTKRLFPLAWREAKLAEQGFKCAIDGKPLKLEDAQGGHIISHADGGLTVYENLAMIRTEHNRKMGSLSLEQYKGLLVL